MSFNSWIPQLKVTGGLIGGSTIPDGSLDDCLNNFILDTAGHGLTTSGSMLRGMIQDEETARWKGAYGRNILSNLYGYAETHVGVVTNDITLAEMVCELPRGAQYWKQTIALVINVGEPTIDETEDYKTLHFVPYFMQIERREYATPYADTYTSTPLNDLYGNLTRQVFLLAGDEEDARGFFADSMIIGAGSFSYDHDNYYGFAIYGRKHRWDGEADRNSIVLLGITKSALDTAFGGSFEPEEKEDPNEEEPPEDGPGKGGGGGGYGDHRLPDESVPIPALPYTGAASLSWLTLYKMSTVNMNDFGQQLVDANLWESIMQYLSNPLDAIVGIMLIPFDAPTTRTRIPSIGLVTWENAYPVVSNEFVELDCGTVNIPPYWDSAFDMSPFTRFQFFLPFIGYKVIDSDEIMGCNVSIKYHIDLCTGDCVAFIIRSASASDIYGEVKTQVIAQFNGNCGVRVPTGRVSHDAAINACLQLMGTAINVGGTAIGAALGDVNSVSSSQVANQISGATMNTVNGMKTHIERSGNIAGAGGYMGVVRPYLIRQIPRQDLPDEYKRLEGYPCNKGGTLNMYHGTGLNTIEAIELQGFTGFDSERDELLNILKGGVII